MSRFSFFLCLTEAGIFSPFPFFLWVLWRVSPGNPFVNNDMIWCFRLRVGEGWVRWILSGKQTYVKGSLRTGLFPKIAMTVVISRSSPFRVFSG